MAQQRNYLFLETYYAQNVKGMDFYLCLYFLYV